MPEPYRADHVGSFLRPSRAREARAAFREGRTGREELARAEDTDITTYPSIAQDCFPIQREIYNLDIKDSQFLYWPKPL